jgi:hypothetical protein
MKFSRRWDCAPRYDFESFRRSLLHRRLYADERDHARAFLVVPKRDRADLPEAAAEMRRLAQGYIERTMSVLRERP